MRSRVQKVSRTTPMTSLEKTGRRPSSLLTRTAFSVPTKKSFSMMSSCGINTDSLKQNTSVYRNEYTSACYNNTQVQVDFLATSFANSNATWKFLQLHHPYVSASTNETDLAPLIEIVMKHNATVINGHDHCMAHFYMNNTNFILSGAAGYPQAGDCNSGVAVGPYAMWLGANNLTGKWEE